MRCVAILGPGASGKSTLAIHLSAVTGLPVIEPDKVFWRPGLAATPPDEWIKNAAAADRGERVNFSAVRCAWRAIRRSRERADFWVWLLRYRRLSRPFLMEAIAKHAGQASLYIIRGPEGVRQFVADAAGIARELNRLRRSGLMEQCLIGEHPSGGSTRARKHSLPK